MREMKDTLSASVRIGYDGRVHKHYRGTLAKDRYQNERSILLFLEKRGCPFVPRVLEEHPDELYLVTSNCGTPAPQISDEKLVALFDELESFGVRHQDRAQRNVTYSPQLGRFCVIDFEFATNLVTGHGLLIEQAKNASLERPKP